MSQAVDLNQLRQTVLANQRRGEDLPASRENKLYVNRQGSIVLGGQVPPGQELLLSEVPQAVFAAPSWRRFLGDRAVMVAKFPAGTRKLCDAAGDRRGLSRQTTPRGQTLRRSGCTN
jgi:hypothetical protein